MKYLSREKGLINLIYIQSFLKYVKVVIFYLSPSGEDGNYILLN